MVWVRGLWVFFCPTNLSYKISWEFVIFFAVSHTLLVKYFYKAGGMSSCHENKVSGVGVDETIIEQFQNCTLDDDDGTFFVKLAAYNKAVLCSN